MYSRSQKFIYIPARKCATTSICHALKEWVEPEDFEKYNLGVLSTGTFGEWKDELIDDNFVFTSTRNPYDKMVSLYHYSKCGDDIWDQSFLFPDFCDLIFNGTEMPENWKHHVYMSTTCLTGGIQDMTLHLENLDHEWECLSKVLNLNLPILKKLYASRNDREYKQYYTDPICRKAVEKYYSDDIEEFGYSF